MLAFLNANPNINGEGWPVKLQSPSWVYGIQEQ